MGLTGDRYVGAYQGHTLEFIANNWTKTVRLVIDGTVVATESRLLPHSFTLTGSLEHDGVQHTVVAKSINRFPFTDDSIEVGGQVLSLTKTK